jgi:hypothetical protein
MPLWPLHEFADTRQSTLQLERVTSAIACSHLDSNPFPQPPVGGEHILPTAPFMEPFCCFYPALAPMGCAPFPPILKRVTSYSDSMDGDGDRKEKMSAWCVGVRAPLCGFLAAPATLSTLNLKRRVLLIPACLPAANNRFSPIRFRRVNCRCLRAISE